MAIPPMSRVAAAANHGYHHPNFPILTPMTYPSHNFIGPRWSEFVSMLRVIALAAVIAGVPCAALAAASSTPPLDEARRLMAAGDAGRAYALLAPHESANAGQPGFDYLLGIAALDSGRPTRAIFALERVLAVEPGNALARAEIGRAYLAAGEVDNARTELEQVRAGPVPQDAMPAINRLLGVITQLQARSTRQFSGYVEAGYGYDSNVNSATAASQLAIPALGGLVFNLDPVSRAADDRFILLGAGGSLRVPLAPDLAFAANVAGSQNFNQHQDRFDSGPLDANAGIAKTVGANVFSGGLQANTTWIGGTRFRDAFGLLGQWQHNLGPSTQTTVFAQLTRLDYPGNTIRNADRWVVGGGYAAVIRSGPVVFVSAYAGQEAERSAGVPHLGHDLAGVRAGVQWQASMPLTLFANVLGEQRRYGGPEPLFGTHRRDNQAGAVVGAHYMVSPAWRLTPQVSYTGNGSNIDIYNFRRVVMSVTLRREF